MNYYEILRFFKDFFNIAEQFFDELHGLSVYDDYLNELPKKLSFDNL